MTRIKKAFTKVLIGLLILGVLAFYVVRIEARMARLQTVIDSHQNWIEWAFKDVK